MRIMVDANIIISAGLFPESIVGEVLSHIVKNHKLVLCKYTIDELRDVFKRKFPKRITYFNKFIKDLKYELFNIDIINFENYPQLRDKDDIPLLAYAIEAKVDLLVSGDKDFDDVKNDSPVILKPREYVEKYILG